MKITYPTCCGVDVHKSFLVATIIMTTRQTGGLLKGYKPLLLGQRLKALAFSLCCAKKYILYSLAQLRSSHTAINTSQPLKGYLYYLAVNP